MDSFEKQKECWAARMKEYDERWAERTKELRSLQDEWKKKQTESQKSLEEAINNLAEAIRSRAQPAFSFNDAGKSQNHGSSACPAYSGETDSKTVENFWELGTGSVHCSIGSFTVMDDKGWTIKNAVQVFDEMSSHSCITQDHFKGATDLVKLKDCYLHGSNEEHVVSKEDSTFLEALPADSRAEVLALQQAQSVQPSTYTLPAVDEMNSEFLAALPSNIQAEVLAQQRAQSIVQQAEDQPVILRMLDIPPTAEKTVFVFDPGGGEDCRRSSFLGTRMFSRGRNLSRISWNNYS